MNEKRKKYYEREGKVSQRFSRGLKAFGKRYFSYGGKSYWRRRKYDRELRRSSPGLQFVWIIVLIILLITIENESKIYILYIFVPVYLLLLVWEIWLMGAPAKERKKRVTSRIEHFLNILYPFDPVSKMDLKGRSMLSLKDYTKEEIRFLLDESKKLKTKFKAFKREELPLEGLTLGMIFQKRSTRTRVSTEVAMYYLGGHALFLSSADMQLGAGETIKDTSRVLSRMVDGILARVYAHDDVVELAKHSKIPVINALSDRYHPLQILADLLTIEEHKEKLAGLKLAWSGDGNNVCNSLLIGCAKMGLDMSVATPKGYEPPAGIVALAKEFAEETGAKIIVTNDAVSAVTDADVIVTDTFVSMGEEDQEKAKLEAFKDYIVTKELCANAKSDYIFLHCLPYKHKEATEEVFESEHSVVFDEAENRLHTVAAVLKNLMG